jgi:hypothetical protein
VPEELDLPVHGRDANTGAVQAARATRSLFVPAAGLS